MHLMYKKTYMPNKRVTHAWGKIDRGKKKQETHLPPDENVKFTKTSRTMTISILLSVQNRFTS